MTEPKIEPYRLRKWRRPEQPKEAVHTCARPGRSEENSTKDIDDAQVKAWLLGLPPSIDTVISLLGTKKDGRGEYRFYNFDYPKSSPEAWLNSFGIRRLSVIERPTIDNTPVPNETIDIIREDVRRLLASQRQVVIVDSGGLERTGQVCLALGMKKLARISMA